MDTYSADTVTTVVSAVSVRTSAWAADNEAPLIADVDHPIGMKRKQSPSLITDYAPSKKFKRGCPKCGEKRPRLVVSSSRSPTSESYSQPSPSYYSPASPSYYNPAPPSYFSPALLSYSYYSDSLNDTPPSDASTLRSLYELIFITSDPASGASPDYNSYSSSSQHLCSTCKREMLMNGTVPITDVINSLSSHTILKSDTYTMTYWSQNLSSPPHCPVSRASPSHSPTASP